MNTSSIAREMSALFGESSNSIESHLNSEINKIDLNEKKYIVNRTLDINKYDRKDYPEIGYFSNMEIKLNDSISKDKLKDLLRDISNELLITPKDDKYFKDILKLKSDINLINELINKCDKLISNNDIDEKIKTNIMKLISLKDYSTNKSILPFELIYEHNGIKIAKYIDRSHSIGYDVICPPDIDPIKEINNGYLNCFKDTRFIISCFHFNYSDFINGILINKKYTKFHSPYEIWKLFSSRYNAVSYLSRFNGTPKFITITDRSIDTFTKIFNIQIYMTVIEKINSKISYRQYGSNGKILKMTFYSDENLYSIEY